MSLDERPVLKHIDTHTHTQGRLELIDLAFSWRKEEEHLDTQGEHEKFTQKPRNQTPPPPDLQLRVPV